MLKVKDVMRVMEEIAPPALAAAGDPAGLHAGDPEAPADGVLLALDASLAVLSEARRKRRRMLVVHHPRFWRGLSTLAENDPAGRRAAAVAASGLAVYSAHTALDVAAGGVNDCLARAAGLEKTEVIKPTLRERLVKLAVFVPVPHVEAVRKAICAAGAGWIGKYSDCTFRARGVGTFRCGSDARPFQGRPGSFEEADEYRLETVFGEFSLPAVRAALLAAHPYEEAAYDLYPLLREGNVYGFGRVGPLPAPEPLGKLAARLAGAVGSAMTQFHGRPGRLIRRLAVWAGGGVDVGAAAACGADALAAGEIGYHDVETLTDSGLAVITLGHGCSEAPVLRPLARRLGKLLGGKASIGIAANPGLELRNVDDV